MRFRRNGREVEALQFDGSSASAAEISRRFGDVAHHGTSLQVATPFGCIYAGAGMWIVRDRATRALHAVDHREFAAYEALA